MHKVSEEHLTLAMNDSLQKAHGKEINNSNDEFSACLNNLSASVQNYHEKNENFSFKELKQNWENCQSNMHQNRLSPPTAAKWIEATGLLLELTEEAKYAEALEKLYLNTSNEEIKRQAASYVFTKNVDHLHVNLFIPATIEYEHTLHGHVKMEQETRYPGTGRIELHFSMEKNRYIELYIRIPSWAKDAQVIVEGVKYVAPAGGYCKVAKKWHEGDTAEIIFPGIHNQKLG